MRTLKLGKKRIKRKEFAIFDRVEKFDIWSQLQRKIAIGKVERCFSCDFFHYRQERRRSVLRSVRRRRDFFGNSLSIFPFCVAGVVCTDEGDPFQDMDFSTRWMTAAMVNAEG
jgi:hypothetical protein